MGLDQYLNVYCENFDKQFTYRKVNFLRGWMIRNTSLTENDNCKEVTVPLERLKELLKNCNDVLNNHDKADELLPSHSGFFFGTYDYDEWYFRGVEQVRDDLNEIIKIDMEYDIEFITYSDWW